MAQILDDPVYCKLYDLQTGAAGEALVRAATVGNLVAVKTLLTRKANPNIANGKALHKACLEQNINVIRLLMQFGVDLNAKSIWAEYAGK